MADERLIPPSLAPAVEDLLTTTARDALRLIVESADLIEGDGEARLVVPATPALIDALAAFEADEVEREDEGDAEEEPDGEPSLGSIDNRMNQSQAWRAASAFGLDLEFDGDNVPDPDLEEGYDRELDPAEDGLGDMDGLLEQGCGEPGGEPSLGATEEIDQRIGWARSGGWLMAIDGEATGTVDDLAAPLPTIEQREAQDAAVRAAAEKLQAIAGPRAYGGGSNLRALDAGELIAGPDGFFYIANPLRRR